MDRSAEQSVFVMWQEISSCIMAEVSKKDLRGIKDFFKIVDPISDHVLKFDQNQLSPGEGQQIIENLLNLKKFLEAHQCAISLTALAEFNATIEKKLQAIKLTGIQLRVSEAKNHNKLLPLFMLPSEVITERMVSYLIRPEAENLARTCTALFFSSALRYAIRNTSVETQFFMGTEHGFLMDAAKNVFSFGNNYCGQLGLGHRQPVDGPQLVQFPEGKKVQTIAAGNEFSLFLFTDGTLYFCGAYAALVADVGDSIKMTQVSHALLDGKQIKAIAARDDAMLILCTDNTLIGVGSCFYTRDLILIPFTGEAIQSIAIGSSHIMVLCDNGQAFARGCNLSGQLGVGYNSKFEAEFKPVVLPYGCTGIKAMALGISHSLVFGKNNKVYKYETDDDGFMASLGVFQFADDGIKEVFLDPEKQAQAIACAEARNFVLYTDGTLCSFGDTMNSLFLPNGASPNSSYPAIVRLPTLVQIDKGIHVQAVACYLNHLFVADAKGQVYTYEFMEIENLRRENVDEVTIQLVPLTLPKVELQTSASTTTSTPKDNSKEDASNLDTGKQTIVL